MSNNRKGDKTMKKYNKPDLGEKYFGIETIKKYVKEIQDDYEHNYKEDILGYVLWILDDYKRLKQGDGTNFSRITASPEALAEFMAKHEVFPCGYIVDCDNCSFGGKCSDDNFLPSNYEKWEAWLKQESKE